MKERRLKKVVIYSLFGLLVMSLCTGLYLIEHNFSSTKEQVNYIDKTKVVNEEPVMKEDKVLIKPYTSDNIEILSSFYDSNSDANNQQKSIIYYDNTYIQNNGVIYGQDSQFDVVAIYDGEVIKVEESDLLGKTIQIKHSDDLISIYQLLGSTDVSVNTKVVQGQKIGTSNVSNILNNNKQQLYFELVLKGKFVNAEQYFGKKLAEI